MTITNATVAATPAGSPQLVSTAASGSDSVDPP